MKSIITGVLATVTAIGLLSACSSDAKVTVQTNAAGEAGGTLPEGVSIPDFSIPDFTIPDGGTLPPGVSIPSDVSIPQEAVDLMIAQFEAAGMKIDKECFEGLMNDEALRDLVASGGTPTPEVIQKFVACIKP